VTIDPLESYQASPGQFLELLLAYLRLLPSFYYRQAGMPEYDEGPVCASSLAAEGISPDSMQWMLFQGHVDHFSRNPGPGDSPWLLNPSAVIGADSALALTDLGEAFGGGLFASLLPGCECDALSRARGRLRLGWLTPRYRERDRLLLWGSRALKCYRQPSANQELILLAAEELAWQVWLDDPLPRSGKIDPKQRLHDAIKNLNRHQTPHLIAFRGDGTGTKIGWVLR
jgi:hypothetical protein